MENKITKKKTVNKITETVETIVKIHLCWSDNELDDSYDIYQKVIRLIPKGVLAFGVEPVKFEIKDFEIEVAYMLDVTDDDLVMLTDKVQKWVDEMVAWYIKFKIFQDAGLKTGA